MKFTKEDKEYLACLGYNDWDIEQIEEASNYIVCSSNNETISLYEAELFLGRQFFINGLAGATFQDVVWRTSLNNYTTICMSSVRFSKSGKKLDIYTNFADTIEFLEWIDENGMRTLYYKTSPRYLNQDHEYITGAKISLEYELETYRSSRNIIVKISPTNGEMNYEWTDFNIPYEYIDVLFRIADEAMKNVSEKTLLNKNESKLIDGITECCGFDFGLDQDKANFCPVCGKKLIHV